MSLKPGTYTRGSGGAEATYRFNADGTAYCAYTHDGESVAVCGAFYSKDGKWTQTGDTVTVTYIHSESNELKTEEFKVDENDGAIVDLRDFCQFTPQ